MFITALAAVCLMGFATVALGATSFKTTLVFQGTQPTADPDELNFFGKINSPKATCKRGRQVRFATAPAGSGGPFTPVGSTTSDTTGQWDRDIDVTGSPDIKVSTPRKKFGPTGNRKTCKSHAILLTAG
mgnify:CR=1 FL=1